MQFTAVILLICVPCCAAAARADSSELPLDQTIAKLRSVDLADRDIGAESLDAMAKRGLTLEEGLKIIPAAREKEPTVEGSKKIVHSVASEMLRVLADHPRPEYLQPVAEAFDRYPADAKDAAMAIFIGLGPGRGTTFR